MRNRYSRDTWQINERRITLGLLHVLTAAFATGQHVVKDRSQVEFDQDTSVSSSPRFLLLLFETYNHDFS